MSKEILLLADALAREKSVSKDVVFTALEHAIASASKKRFKGEADVRVAKCAIPPRRGRAAGDQFCE